MPFAARFFPPCIRLATVYWQGLPANATQATIVIHLTPAIVLAREINRMQTLLSEGPNPCYKDFTAFLYDYYPDFSWDERSQQQFEALLADNTWLALAQQVKDKLDWDFVAELTDVLKEENEE